jgi:hypothetical protein
MDKPGSPAHGERRLVQRIVLTYTLEGDAEQREYTVTLSRDEGGARVDGVVWSRTLMDRLGYQNDQQGCVPVPRRPARPDDGWRKNGGAAQSRNALSDPAATDLTAADATLQGAGEECIWLHRETCTWVSWCETPPE